MVKKLFCGRLQSCTAGVKWAFPWLLTVVSGWCVDVVVMIAYIGILDGTSSVLISIVNLVG